MQTVEMRGYWTPGEMWGDQLHMEGWDTGNEL
jgi:hypothetical protein